MVPFNKVVTSVSGLSLTVHGGGGDGGGGGGDAGNGYGMTSSTINNRSSFQILDRLHRSHLCWGYIHVLPS